MGLNRFLSLLAASMGLIGAVFLAKGVLIQSAEDMINSTTHYSACAWPSKKIISSMSIQKADTVTGIVYIFIAFLIQLVSLIFLKGEIIFIKKWWMSIGIAFILIFILTITFYLINNGIRNHNVLKMEKIVVRDYFTDRFVGKAVDTANIQGLEDMSKEYFNLNREDSESDFDFVKKIAQYVGWSIPSNIDFSRIDENNK